MIENNLLDQLIHEATELPKISKEASNLYRKHKKELKDIVNSIMERKSEINKLIGFNPHKTMFINHKHHAEFMSSIFYIGDYMLMTRTIPWVYRAYKSQHFSYDYFQVELNAWITAINSLECSTQMQGIIRIYKWLLNNHEKMITLSLEESSKTPPIHPDWLKIKNHFQVSLLNGNSKTCINIAEEFISEHSLNKLYTEIIGPAMYEVGYLWEKGIVSVAQEHMASSIVTRIMATIINNNHTQHTTGKGKILLTAAPNEFHEIGIWMVADIMEQAGWDIRFTGADTPQESLIEMLISFKPDVLAISVTIPFNLDKAKDMISAIKNNPELDNVYILAGGRIFNENPELWKHIGADGSASTPEEAESKSSEQLCKN